MKTSLLILSSFLSLLLSQSLIAAPKPSPKAPAVTSTTKLKSFEEHQKECYKLVKVQGIKDDGVVKELCACTIAKFRQKYNNNVQAFNAVVEKSKTDKKAKKELAMVGEACFFDE